MKREAMINRLVEDDIDAIKQGMQNNDVQYLDYVLRFGVSYDKMSDEELATEFENRTWEIENEAS